MTLRNFLEFFQGARPHSFPTRGRESLRYNTWIEHWKLIAKLIRVCWLRICNQMFSKLHGFPTRGLKSEKLHSGHMTYIHQNPLSQSCWTRKWKNYLDKLEDKKVMMVNSKYFQINIHNFFAFVFIDLIHSYSYSAWLT